MFQFRGSTRREALSPAEDQHHAGRSRGAGISRRQFSRPWSGPFPMGLPVKTNRSSWVSPNSGNCICCLCLSREAVIPSWLVRPPVLSTSLRVLNPQLYPAIWDPQVTGKTRGPSAGGNRLSLAWSFLDPVAAGQATLDITELWGERFLGELGQKLLRSSVTPHCNPHRCHAASGTGIVSPSKKPDFGSHGKGITPWRVGRTTVHPHCSSPVFRTNPCHIHWGE